MISQISVDENNQKKSSNIRYTKRVKLRARYNYSTLRYDIKEKVKVFLDHYNIDFDEFESTLQEIESDVNLRPFHN
jgi:hypothetical protein